jgi:hypothetical protein
VAKVKVAIRRLALNPKDEKHGTNRVTDLDDVLQSAIADNTNRAKVRQKKSSG